MASLDDSRANGELLGLLFCFKAVKRTFHAMKSQVLFDNLVQLIEVQFVYHYLVFEITI